MLPSLFVSHGAPTLALDNCPARQFLMGLGAELPRPRAILAVSAHWDNSAPIVNRVAVNSTIHDFSGFPEALYRMNYPAPGSCELADRTKELLTAAGFRPRVDEARGLDHGAWVPLTLMYPSADVPVVQLSIQSHLSAEHHLRLGRTLAPLRQENILLLGAGSFSHNLRLMDRRRLDGPEPQWVSDFSEWMHRALMEGRCGDLISYRKLAPYAVQAHPEEDHLMPLFVALGAGGEDAAAKRLHSSTTYGTLRMDDYAFS